MKSWKTMLAGIAMLLSLLAKGANNPKAIDQTDIATGIAAVGLILAKDGDVTGGSRQQ